MLTQPAVEGGESLMSCSLESAGMGVVVVALKDFLRGGGGSRSRNIAKLSFSWGFRLLSRDWQLNEWYTTPWQSLTAKIKVLKIFVRKFWSSNFWQDRYFSKMGAGDKFFKVSKTMFCWQVWPMYPVLPISYQSACPTKVMVKTVTNLTRLIR